MKVYVVTSGFYDDLHAIFDDEQIAEKVASYIWEARVTEWVINDLSEIRLDHRFIDCERRKNIMKNLQKTIDKIQRKVVTVKQKDNDK